MSEYGIRINNTGGQRQIDNQKLVPQLIATVDMAQYPYETYYGGNPQTDYMTVQDGWTRRVYYNYPVPQVTIGRPCIRFFSIPTTNTEVFTDGYNLMYQNDPAGFAPKIYYFALDSVSYGSSQYGRRVWNAQGGLIYDSGNKHLNIHQMVGNVNVNTQWNTGSHTSYGYGTDIWLPRGAMSSPALCVPNYECSNYWGNKLEVGDARGTLFYRMHSDGRVISKLLNYDSQLDTVTSNTPYNKLHQGNSSNMLFMLIDRYPYD